MPSDLIKDAIGSRLFCVYVDTGLMRKHETAYVEKMYKELGFENFEVVDASALFLGRLRDVADPEEKRNTIADLMQLRKEIVEEFDEELEISKKDFRLDIHKFRLVTSAEIAEKLSFVMENCAVIEDYSGAGVQIEFL